MSTISISAIILSAGLSVRMGAFKPLLPLGNGTIIRQAVTNFQQAGIEEVYIVLGNRASDIIPHIDDMDVSWVVNEDFQAEMFTSVQIGVDQLSPDIKAFFLLPVDVPLIRPQTFLALINASAEQPDSIIHPVFAGTRGHPPLIPQKYMQALLAYRGGGGLRGFLDQFEQYSLEVPVYDQGILMDIDTPDQYEGIKRRYQKWMLPTEAECLAMLAMQFATSDPMMQHAKAVARLTQKIAINLKSVRHPIDVELVTACGYLHDIGKGHADHAQYGADLLIELGYPQIASIVATHMDLEYNAQDDITEKEVLFLADKKISGTRTMALDKRLSSKLKKLANNPKGREAAEKRLGTAQKIEQRIYSIIGAKNDNSTQSSR